MTERMMQVPVSLIHALVDTVGSKGMPTDVYLAFSALIDPPTPSAEAMLPVRAVVAVMDTYDNGDGECEPEDRWRLFRDMRSLLASGQVVSPAPAAPPSIEDMAPGTTNNTKEKTMTMPDLPARTVIDAVCER